MHNKFHAKFKKILNENPELERDAMIDSLDDGTDIDDFDMDMEPSTEGDEVADAISRQQQQQLNELQGWIDQIDGFLTFMNGDDPSSIQSKLAKAVPDTIMDKVKTSQQSKISRIASDLASFHQALLGFKAMSNSPHLKNV